MSSLSSLSAVTTAATALSNLVLVTPQTTVGYQPQNPPNMGGNLNNFLQPAPPALLFHYEGEQTVSLESDITDHFIEDNTSIQDQIALRPEIITTHGFIGELNDVPPPGLAIVQAAANKLTSISAYVPALSTTALIAYNEAFAAYQIANSATNAAISAWSSIIGDNGTSVIDGGTEITEANNQNRQQTMFQQFYAYWRNRYLFTVQTPWAVFQNCAIFKLRAIQSEETNVISDFEVTFKLIRMASTESTPFNLAAGRLNSQSAVASNNGTSTPQTSTSLTTGLAGGR